jgi:GntR family transcriptional regulator
MFRFSDRKEPLYASIKRELLSKIERGTWPIGHKLPREEELQEQYQVSRGTVRRALSELESEGLISRTAAKGTFVTRVTPKLEKALGEIVSLSQKLSQAGFEVSTVVLSAETIPAAMAEGRVEAGFGIPPGASVVHIRRLRQANGVPFTIQSVYLRPELCPGILEEDLTHLFRLYEEKFDRRIITADETIRVSTASADEARLLALAPGDPVVIRDRISYDQRGEPFEVLHSVDRGDRFEYRYRIVNDLTEIAAEMAPRPPSYAERKWR